MISVMMKKKPNSKSFQKSAASLQGGKEAADLVLTLTDNNKPAKTSFSFGFGGLYLYYVFYTPKALNKYSMSTPEAHSFFLFNYLFRYSSIALAACLPAPIAKITVAAPVTASPPA